MRERDLNQYVCTDDGSNVVGSMMHHLRNQETGLKINSAEPSFHIASLRWYISARRVTAAAVSRTHRSNAALLPRFERQVRAASERSSHSPPLRATSSQAARSGWAARWRDLSGNCPSAVGRTLRRQNPLLNNLMKHVIRRPCAIQPGQMLRLPRIASLLCQLRFYVCVAGCSTEKSSCRTGTCNLAVNTNSAPLPDCRLWRDRRGNSGAATSLLMHLFE
jgi:hypothetical protein